MNLGLMSLGPHELKRKIKFGDKRAKKVYEVRKNGNLLLVTLLLGNVTVNSALSVFLGSFTVGIVAIVVSTALITLFGEIIPQAILSRYALSIGSKLTWLVWIFIYVFYPVAKPIAWALDKILGDELPTVYSRNELLSIIEEHSAHDGSDIDQDEEQIATGALSFSGKKAAEVMTPVSHVMQINSKDVINAKLYDRLRKNGHTRYPVYRTKPGQIVGILNVKDLLGETFTTVESAMRKQPIFVRDNTKLDNVLKKFLTTRQHLFVVTDRNKQFLGVITIEDILEEILQTEIIDEFDTQTN
jgi:metal transporter CNNM